jgi:WD40 repeat protein
VLLWDAPRRQVVQRLTTGGEHALSVDWTRRGNRLCSTTFTGRLVIWRGARFQHASVVAAHSGPASMARWRPDGRRIASVGWDGFLRIWMPNTGGLEREFSFPAWHADEEQVLSIAWSPSGRWLVTSDTSGRLLLWEPSGRGLITVLRDPRADGELWDSRPVEWSPSSLLAARSYPNGSVTVVDPLSEATVEEIQVLPHRKIEALAWSPDASRLAIGVSGQVRVVLASGASVATLPVSADITAIAWSPDSKSIAIASEREPAVMILAAPPDDAGGARKRD